MGVNKFDQMTAMLIDIGERVARIDRNQVLFEGIRFNMLGMMIEGLVEAQALHKPQALAAIQNTIDLLAMSEAQQGAEHVSALRDMAIQLKTRLQKIP